MVEDLDAIRVPACCSRSVRATSSTLGVGSPEGVVEEHDGGRAVHRGHPEDLTGMDEARVQRSCRHDLGAQHAVLRAEADDADALHGVAP